MAEIYNKTINAGTAKCVITDFKQAFKYPFNVGDWTRIRAYLSWSYTAAGPNDNMDGHDAVFVPIGTDDTRMYYGLTRYQSGFPNFSQYPFVGFKSYGVESDASWGISPFSFSAPLGKEVTIGVHHIDGTKEGAFFSNITGPRFEWINNGDSSIGVRFTGLLALDMTIVNKGQSNQKMTFKWGQAKLDETTPSYIESIVNGMTFSDLGDLEFNFNGVPYEVPDSFFMYTPFGEIRQRVFAIQVIRLA